MEIKAKSTKVEDLHAFLVEERERLLTEIACTDVSGREQAGYGNHMADDATEVFEQAKHLALRCSLEKRLGQVEDALRKMELGRYGVCEACGATIDPARLKAIPSAGLCFACQVHAEERSGNGWHKSR